MEQLSSPLTGEMIRAARALLRLDQARLAQQSGVSLETVRRLERVRGPVDAHVRTLERIVETFNALGVDLQASDAGGVIIRLCGAAPAPPPPGPRTVRRPPPSRRVHRLIYFSSSTAGSDGRLRSDLADIDRSATEEALVRSVSTILIACDGRFLQMIEGDKSAVLEIYGRISTDPRHRDLQVLESSDHYVGSDVQPRATCRYLGPSDPFLTLTRNGEPCFRPEVLSAPEAGLLLTAVRDGFARAA